MSHGVSDKGKQALDKRIREIKKQVEITVGIHDDVGANPKEASEGEATEGTLIEIAAQHEYGIGVPQRSFIGGYVDEAGSKPKEALARIFEQVTAGKMTAEQAGQRFGVFIAGQMQKRIADGIEPELVDITKARKMSLTGEAKDTPLILTGQLRSSIASKAKVK